MHERLFATSTMKNPNHMVIHIGTDDLPARKQTDTTANDIVEIELTCDVSILNTVLRKEQYTKKKDLCKKSCTIQDMAILAKTV